MSSLNSPTETNFSHNGEGILIDTVSCLVTENRNGSYEVELIYPVGSFLFDRIGSKSIIKAKANDRYNAQLFRVYNISKPIRGKITIKAEHISYRLKDNFIESFNYTGNCASTLSSLNNSATFESGFSFNSNLTPINNYVFERKNFLSTIMADEVGSILNTLGNNVDIVRDNFNFNILTNGGQDKNALIAYKKNMTDFKCEENSSAIITKIYPYATTGDTTITLAEKYIESPYISNYPNEIIQSVDFTSYFDTEAETITEATLRTKCSTYFIDTECDIPALTYDIEFVALSKTEEYKNFALNESIGINDTVIIRHDIYGLDSKAKVTNTIYDSIAEKYTKIKVGQPKESISTLLNGITANIKDATKDNVKIVFLDKAMNELSDAITGNDGGCVKLNPPSNPSEILVMDNEDINLASTVWRWNKEGLGVSTTGYNGNYVGLAKNGKLVVNAATCNLLTANFIKMAVIDSINTN